MKTADLRNKLYLENVEFITSEELKARCQAGNLDYENTLRYFGMMGYVVRIFRGIFYVPTLLELKTGYRRYGRLKLVAKGLEIKGVKNWYFGLYTALKFNHMTHEYFVIDDVVSDSIFRQAPMEITGCKFKFTKVSPHLLRFGIMERDGMRYSDPEKTILDFAYIQKYNGFPEAEIAAYVSDWAKHISKKTLGEYATKYPRSIARIAEMIE